MEVDPNSDRICLEHQGDACGQPGKVYVGPFALKLQHIEIASQTYENQIIERIQQVASDNCDLGSDCILIPDYVLRGDSILEVVRGYHGDKAVPECIREYARDRREVFTISPFKRTLGQYECFEEVARATLDIYKAIAWLDKHGFVHRDISHGNVLLAREDLTQFRDPVRLELNLLQSKRCPSGKMTLRLYRRTPHGARGVYGLLHDFDMVASKEFLSQRSDLSQKTIIFRTGTPPFMSIGLLAGHSTSKSQNVGDDAQSTFYCLYLFPFTYGAPESTPTYPHTSLRPRLKWPEAIIEWTRGTHLRQLGQLKKAFFEERETWMNNPFTDVSQETKSSWMEGTPPRESWEKLVTLLHDRFLWSFHEPSSSWYPHISTKVLVSEIISGLETHIRDNPAAFAQYT